MAKKRSRKKCATDVVLDAIERVLEHDAVRVEKLTGHQLADVVRQAIECGDFMRFVDIKSGGGTRIDYVPRREHDSMLKFIKDLKVQVLMLQTLVDEGGEALT